MLNCFGPQLEKFSISDYIWNKIFHASEDLVKHFPYAPFLKHIIQQVTGYRFPTDVPHASLKVTNLDSIQVRKERKEDAATASGVPSRSHRASSEDPTSSSSSGKKGGPGNKFTFVLQHLFGACCASAQRE